MILYRIHIRSRPNVKCPTGTPAWVGMVRFASVAGGDCAITGEAAKAKNEINIANHVRTRESNTVIQSDYSSQVFYFLLSVDCASTPCMV